MKISLSSVRLLVDPANFDECFRFYHEILDGEVTWGKPGEVYAEFRFAGGSTTLALFRRDINNASLGLPEQEPAPARTDRVALVFQVEDVHHWARELGAKGVAALAPPTDRDAWGVRTAHFRDPDGNLIEINQPLAR